MAGILNKKSRNIDYKLTKSGLTQLSQGRLKFKYYTLSDKSVIYSSEFNKQKKELISTTEKNYLPFEISSYASELNPELYLDEIVSIENKEDKFFFNNVYTDSTIGEKLINEELLFNKNETTEEKIDFSSKDVFTSKKISSLGLQTYPTLVLKEINTKNIKNISNDDRFFDKLRFKKLPPVNIERVEKNIFDLNSGLNYFFKKLSSEEITDVSFNKKQAGLDIIEQLEKNTLLFKNVYEIRKDTSKINDAYIFQLFEKNEENLEKLHFISLGSFYDEKLNLNKEIYLIGKLLRKISKSDEINRENYTKKININEDYSFVNIFTLVVE